MSYRLKDQRGRPVGPPFPRYQEAFNHRVSLNRPDLRVVEEPAQ